MAVQKKKATTAIVPWEQRFATAAKAAVEQEKSIGMGGLGIKFGPGTITVAGGNVPQGKLECIMLGACFENAWYGDRPYSPDDPQPPECYAFGIMAEDMAPGADVADKQCETCADCDKNQWGSATTGRGKACSNKKRLALILAKDAESGESVATAELATAKVSPTNLKSYAGYVRALQEEHGRPPWAVVTEISSHPDPNTQIRIEFRLVELIEDDDLLTALEKRAEPEKVQAVLQQPYGPAIVRPAKPAPSGNPKFAAKGKVGRR